MDAVGIVLGSYCDPLPNVPVARRERQPHQGGRIAPLNVDERCTGVSSGGLYDHIRFRPLRQADSVAVHSAPFGQV